MRGLKIKLLAVLLGIAPGAALSAACDAEPGARFAQSAALGDWEVGQIARLTPEGPAWLYLSACGFDCVAGIATPRRAWEAAMTTDAQGITLTLSQGGQARGQLRFAWQQSYEWFGADTALTGTGAGALYTEMRFAGTLTGSGDFAAGPFPAELVLSGAGNACIVARGFSGFSLSVEGPGARYRLFGRLRER